MARDVMIQHHLKRLRLPAMARHYCKVAQEAAEQNQPYDGYLLRLLELEGAQREENTRKRRIAQARFPYLRTLDQFQFSAIPSVNKARVLELAKGDYVAAAENVVLMGNMGTGKTHTAIALGLLACQQGRRVRFFTATALINELLEAREQGGLGKRLAHLQKLDMPILLDRLTHRCHVLEFNGDSYRFKESLRLKEAYA